MQIINPLDASRDIEPALMQLASSDNPLEALKGQKLLELVRHLKTQGPSPTAGRQLVLRELWLVPYNDAKGRCLQIWVDWNDYGPLRDGLPETHFRLSMRRGNGTLSIDARAKTVEDAGQVIYEAFGWR